MNMTFTNDCASLEIYKKSLKGTVQDYMITFNEENNDLESVVSITENLFQQLINSLARDLTSENVGHYTTGKA